MNPHHHKPLVAGLAAPAQRRSPTASLSALMAMSVALLAALLLAACGPGVIGTGTGGRGDASIGTSAPEHFDVVGPAALCSVDFAALLNCPPAGSIGDVGAAAPTSSESGTSAVAWTTADQGDPSLAVQATLTGQQIELRFACGELRFVGRWVHLQDGTTAFVGELGSSVSSDTVPLALRVRFIAASDGSPDQVSIQLWFTTGFPFADPWVLRRGPVGGAGLGCGG